MVHSSHTVSSSQTQTIPDIELLFYLFDDTADTKYVFGYETYAQFKDSVPEQKNQNRAFHAEKRRQNNKKEKETGGWNKK